MKKGNNNITDMLARLVTLLGGYQFNFGDERDLQDGVAEVLEQEGIEFDREYKLNSSDRIDFKIGLIGIEIKIGSSFATVVRQLHRYTKSTELEAIVLLTSRSTHQMPAEIDGKPLRTVYIGYTHL